MVCLHRFHAWRMDGVYWEQRKRDGWERGWMNVSKIKWRKGVFLYVVALYLFKDVEELAAVLYIVVRI